MAAFLKKRLVGGRTKRFQADRAMDCDYITDRIIAMSFPYSGVRSLLPDRNNISSVKAFLDTNHGDAYKLYNLSEKKAYKASLFDDRVTACPISSVQAPNLQKIREVCQDMMEWLDADGTNVVVVHCDDGKSTTGLVTCALLLKIGHCTTANEAMRLFAIRRLNSNADLFLQTHFRYANYFEKILRENLRAPSILILSKIAVSIPKLKLKNPWFAVTANGKTLYYNQCTQERNMMMFPCDMFLIDDICIEFYDGTLKNKLAHFSFNCSYVDSYYLGLQKRDIDGCCLDKAHKVFPSSFEIQLSFLSPKDEYEAMKEMGIDMEARNKQTVSSGGSGSAPSEEGASADAAMREVEVDWSKPTMQAIMGNSTLSEQFYDFLKSQLAEESYEFYIECKNNYKPLGEEVARLVAERLKNHGEVTPEEQQKSKELLAMAKRLHEQFLAAGAPYELNLDHIVKLNVENSLRSDSADKNTFDEAMLACFNLMAGDPFFKFLKSEKWWRLARAKRPLSFASRFCATCRRPILPHDPSMKVRDTHYHWHCLKCDNCGAKLRHQANCIIEEDRLSCAACNTHDFFARCAGCQRVLVGDTVNLNGAAYHKDCCTCATCECVVSDIKAAMLRDGLVFCKEHASSPPAEKEPATCAVEDCKGSGDLFAAMGRSWHATCFLCSSCNRAINMTSEEYVELDDSPVCMDCSVPEEKAPAADVCAICCSRFEHEEDKLKAFGRDYHAFCFSCQLCSSKFAGGEASAVANGKGLTFCKSHECSRCKKDLSVGEDMPIFAHDCPWHPDCFCCNVEGCGKFLTSEATSVLAQGLPYCSSHVTSKCGVCSLPVLDCEDELCVMLDDDEKLPYHERCFTCDVCESHISTDEQFSANIVNNNKLLFLCAEHSSQHICASCSETIPSTELVEAHQFQWHAKCLSCALVECQKVHSGEVDGELFNGNLYCSEHFDHVCAVCHTFIIDVEAELRLEAGGGELPYHEACFQCTRCAVPFTVDSDFIAQYDGDQLSFLCAYHEQLCAACESNFSSPPVAAFSLLWHQQCFRCSAAGCLKEHADESAVSRLEDGSLLCKEHVGHRCAVCEKFVLSGDDELYLDLGDGEQVPYHESCFSCADCDVPLSEDSDFVAKIDGQKLSFACGYHGAACPVCGKMFSNVAPVAAFERYYHTHCFQCKLDYCARPFEATGFEGVVAVEEDGSLLCAEHEGHLCAVCAKYVQVTEPELRIELAQDMSACSHERCCACSVCKTPLIDDGAPDFMTKYEDGRLEFTCTFHTQSCARCHEDFLDAPREAFGLQWHPACLACSKCAKRHEGEEDLLLVDGLPLCSAHGDKCAVCQQALTTAEALELEVAGEVARYHDKCHKCERCGIAFGEETEVAASYAFEELHLWCSFHDMTCARCRRTFKDSPPKLAHGKKWHGQCCFCSFEGCGAPLETVKEVEAHRGGLACASHLSTMCAVVGCGRPIKRGESALRFQEHLIHESCFSCQQCGEVLQAAVGNYMVVPTADPAFVKPQCTNHCDRCKKGIAQYALEASGKQFHIECFTCFKCGTRMEGSFGLIDDEFHCVDCLN